jgi:hypothetical protein
MSIHEEATAAAVIPVMAVFNNVSADLGLSTGYRDKAGASSRHARLPADDLKLHINIAARRVGIGADLFVCFLG